MQLMARMTLTSPITVVLFDANKQRMTAAKTENYRADRIAWTRTTGDIEAVSRGYRWYRRVVEWRKRRRIGGEETDKQMHDRVTNRSTVQLCVRHVCHKHSAHRCSLMVAATAEQERLLANRNIEKPHTQKSVKISS